MLTKETAFKLVRYLHSKYIDCELECKHGKSPVPKAYIQEYHPYYILKLTAPSWIDQAIVDNINGYIEGAGLTEEEVRWKIEEGYIKFFGAYKEFDKLKIFE